MSDGAPDIAVIVVAAGSGARLGAGAPKAFALLAGRTILERALYSVSGMSRPAQLIVVVPGDRVRQAEAMCADVVATPVTVVSGGATRQSSVAAGLAVVADGIRIVLVHDAARALTPSGQFDRVIDAVERTGAGVVPGLSVTDTIKRVDASGAVVETVDRSALSAVQTPQGFLRDQLVAAYAVAIDDVTDDAALVAAIGHPVGVIDGDPLAFKITTAADLRKAEQELAEQELAEQELSGQPLAGQRLAAEGQAEQGGDRIGIGTDTHAFDPDAPLWLAGLYWPGEPGLAGHSDGDAVAHAITDALLSAAGLGDIGTVFGSDDPQFARAHGEVFLRETRRRVEAAGFRIGNVSVQLIGVRPRFSPRRAEAQKLLTGILGAPVALAATTTDGLGFTGRGEGIAAIATALLHGTP